MPCTITTRRGFLTGAAAVGLGAGVTPRWTAHVGATTVDHTLVFVFLRGGPDGCSILVPAGDRSYHDGRSGIAVDERDVLPVDTTFGFHPAMAPLLPHLEAGSLAVVPACGSQFETRSHFDQQAHVERGGLDQTSSTSDASSAAGWLARLLDPVDVTGDIGAVAMGGGVPPSLAGASSVVAIDSLDAVGPPDFPGLDATSAGIALRSLQRDGHARVLAATESSLDAIPMLQDAAERTDRTVRTTGRRDADRGFRDVARLIRADIGVRVATLDVGGWDTHVDMGDAEGGSMARRIESLATGMAAFADELGDAFGRATLVAMGEFGRRVAENGSGGTDHGRGGVLLALGGRVAGGRHGEWPGLAPDVLDEGDVPVVTDWRTVVAEIVQGPLGRDGIDDVFPDLGPDRVGIVRS